jgi:hypothetical protein
MGQRAAEFFSRGFEAKKRAEYSGKEYEFDLLGTIKTGPAFTKEFDRLGGDVKTGYLPYNKSIELVKRLQPWDPTNPTRDFLRELRLALIEELGIEAGQENDVKVYTAVGSPLDLKHGVDAFIEVTTEEGRQRVIRRVTLDISLNPRKASGHKADVVITEEIPPPEENEDKYLARVAETAKQMIKSLEAYS